MTNRIIKVFCAFLILAGNARSASLKKEFRFEAPSFSRAGSGFMIEVPGCRTVGDPGEPMLPVYSACFLLPPGTTALAVSVAAREEVILDGSYVPAPMPRQYPLGRPADISAPRNATIYSSASIHPAISASLVTEQRCSGSRLAFVNIYPCRVVPSTGKVTFSPSVTVRITTAHVPGPAKNGFSRHETERIGRLREMIENPEVIEMYVPSRSVMQSSGIEPERIPYVIITSTALAEAFGPLADLKRLQGFQTEIVDTDWISAQFEGSDLQERIRSFIAYAYENWQTEYVLLGGDDEIIPHRGLYTKAGSEIEIDIPSDLYYAALDGDWNEDGDSYFGEPGEEDLLPEVSVGRLPVDSETEVSNFTAKLSTYSLDPQASACNRAVMLGELLWSIDGVDTWSGDYKDEIFFGTSNYGFTTAGIPISFDCSSLYDRDLGYSWTKTQLLPLLNGGMNLINHLGHTNVHYAMRLGIDDMALLENSGPGSMPYVCYSQGCYAASFDNRDDVGVVHAQDAIAEELITGPAGAVAFIGNTRLGWAAPGTTCGVSQYFDRQFFDALFGEGITFIGKAFDDSRIDNIPYISYALVRYVMYELCLIGDPAMLVWTGEPGQLSVEHDSILVTGQEGFSVHVTGAQGPVAGACVALYSDPLNIYCTACTGETGTALLEPSIPATGELRLSVMAPDHLLYSGTVPIRDATSALLNLDYVKIDDDAQGTSSGDGDGCAESGEIIELGVIISNTGTAAATNIELLLSCQNPSISIFGGTCSLGDIPPRCTLIRDCSFIVRLDTDIPDGCDLGLDFEVISEQGQWDIRYHIPVNAPEVVLESWAITDTISGNGNGCIEAWEFQTVHTAWRNNGNIAAAFPVVRLSAPDGSWAIVNKHLFWTETLPPGGVLEGELEFYVRDQAPPFAPADVILSIKGDNLPLRSETLSIRVCGYEFDDAVGEEEPWEHRSIVGVDGWHISDDKSYSGPSSWKCGADGSLPYANMMDAVLVTPPLCLYENSVLTFQHTIEAEAGDLPPYWAEDAGIVEISTDGGDTWSIITPRTAYPARMIATNTIFLDPYTRCYSGSIDWRTEEFDLSAYQGPVFIRFHFASNEQYGFDGWYIDDIRITTERTTDVPGDTPDARHVNALGAAYPNPFNPVTVIPFEIAESAAVELAVFDVSGRLVRTLLKERLAKGNHRVMWDGKDRSGREVSSGVYFCRMKAGFYSATQRLVLLR